MATNEQVETAITDAITGPKSYSVDGERADARSADEIARLAALNAGQAAANSGSTKKKLISSLYMRIRPNGSV